MKKIVFFVFLFTSFLVYSLEPPKPFELDNLKKSGEFQKRQEFAKKIGNHILKFNERGEKLPGVKGLPTSGTPKIFVLLIDFNDYPHTIDSSVIKSMIFGEGDSANYPYESLKSYYERSSYGKLKIEGDLFGWYRASNLRDYYTNDAEGLIEEAINYFHSQGNRFEKYDNDGDGEIDYFAVFWTGPDTGWATFWWGWQGYFGDNEYLIDGKRLGDFSWQWEEDNPGTIIHETGHALGLPDYYDY
ncbi:MAG: M6 family metalloprotease domain-containing protein, partial [Thermoanaerobaculaceae bacterium]|nr:M6 family metalloprotease domain-containing protein [Thermoanaerobaculaceae bacterium]